MKKKDLLLISSLFLIILLVYIFARLESSQGESVLIQADGKDFIRVSINEDRTIKVPGPLGESIVEIKDRRVRMLYSPCPDKLCEREGYISKPGQIIVCVPNRILIKIEARAPFDALTY